VKGIGEQTEVVTTVVISHNIVITLQRTTEQAASQCHNKLLDYVFSISNGTKKTLNNKHTKEMD
jgi:hypothetical protein